LKIDVSGLSFSFGNKPVLKDISFEVGDGEFLGLMGPNGSGKTTLLRCLMNYLSPKSGTISIDGKILSELSAGQVARTFAVVPQSSATDFTFSAYDIVMMGRIPHMSGRLTGTTKEDIVAVRTAMERTNTWQFAGRQFSALSGGERQRIIIARALAQQPKALLLDEPTVYLDISGQIEIMDLIRRLNKETGITVVAVLHDVNLAARYCDRIALLSNGTLEIIGPPSEVITPATVQAVYGVDVVIRKDPFTNAVYVLPSSLGGPIHRHGTRVHVLSGGGTGGPVLKALHDRGYSVSTGVLNVLDTDFENAKDLHIPTVAEIPFAQISDEAHSSNLSMIDESSAVVVTRFPVGPGNLKNLEAAMHAIAGSKKVFILTPPGGKDYDFVGGKAETLVERLVASGAIQVRNIHDLLSALKGVGVG
jgi:iron complex transport system ATP-binding protein